MEAGDKLRVTIISPGLTQTDITDAIPSAEGKTYLKNLVDSIGMPPDAVARAIAYAIEQPADVDVGEIVIRPTAQG